MRPVIAPVVVLALALGVSLGLAAPALADSGFTAVVTNLPVTTTSLLTFSGTKSSGATVTAITVADAGSTYSVPLSDCTGFDVTSVSWSCSYDPDGELQTGEVPEAGTIELVVANSDGSIEHDVLTFDVYADGTTSPTTSDYPLMSYLFAPAAVTVTATPSQNSPGIYYQQLVPPDSEPLSGCNPPGSGASSCSYSGLDSGESGNVYENDASETAPQSDDNEDYYPTTTQYFTVLPAPTEYQVVEAGSQTATVTGGGAAGLAGYAAIDILNENGAVVCMTTTFLTPPASANDGDWSCTTGDLGYGTHTLTAVLEDRGSQNQASGCDSAGECVPYYSADNGSYYINGALSAQSAGIPITFTAPITPDWTFGISGEPDDLQPGETVTISGSGLPVGTTIDTVLHSVPTDLGSVVAGADGTFTQTVTIPADTVLGAHDLIVTASGPGVVTTSKQQPITVVAAASPASTSVGTITTPSVTTTTSSTTEHPTALIAPPAIATTGSNSAPSVTFTPKVTKTKTAIRHESSTGSIAPNILTQALWPIADVVVHPAKIVSAVEIGLVLLLLAALPAHLLNATIAEQSDRFTRRFSRIRRRPAWLTALIGWFRSAPVAGSILVTAVTAVLFGFADPNFGFTFASLRLILACAIAMFIIGYVVNSVVTVIARARWSVTVSIAIRPYGLILTVAGVLASRLLDFSPGFLIGMILGLAIEGKSAAGYAWRIVMLRTGMVLGLGVLAWIGYSTLTLGGTEGGTFGSQLVVETLVAITTEGVVALLVELLPLRFLVGERLYAHSRMLWAVVYVVTVIVFVLAVVPWEGNWDALGGSLWIWITVLAVFAAICLGVYVYFRRFAPPLIEEAGSEEVSLGETVAGDRS